MISSDRILFTGGGGRLGGEVRKLLPGLVTPDLPEFDITRPGDVNEAVSHYRPELIVHAAAYTNVPGAEEHREDCWRVNVDGTRNIVRAALDHNLPVLHISTDYVFDGTRGNYREDDPLGPPFNYYALTKLVAESLVRIVPRHLVIRTSFRPNEWPYPVAFTDIYTSQDYLDVIAPEIVLAIRHFEDIPYDTVHIATERKSTFDLARRRRPDVRPGTKRDVAVKLPDDISLDISRWLELKGRWEAR